MSRARWGTFSVKDHTRPHPFVAEVLMYDRLILPAPPKAASDQLDLWEQWEPDRLKRCLEVLGDLAMPVAWGKQQHEAFGTRYEAAQRSQLEVTKMEFTPLLLQEYLTQKYSEPWPEEKQPRVLVAYPSYRNFSGDYRYLPRPVVQEAAPLPEEEQRRTLLAQTLGYHFLRPTGSGDAEGKGHFKPLQRAVKLANDKGFRESRVKLYGWQDTFLRDWQERVTQMTQGGAHPTEIQQADQEKLAEAVEIMSGLLDEYNGHIKDAMGEVREHFLFLISEVGLEAATVAIEGAIAPHHLVVTVPLGVLKATHAIAKYVRLERKPKVEAGESAPAAMFYTAQKRFGWH